MKAPSSSWPTCQTEAIKASAATPVQADQMKRPIRPIRSPIAPRREVSKEEACIGRPSSQDFRVERMER